MKIRNVLLPLLLAVGSPAQSAVHIVVNTDMPVEAIDFKQLKNLYLGKSNQLNGAYISGLVDRSNDVKAEFYDRVTGLSLGQVNAYWARLRFSGRRKAPTQIGDDIDFEQYMTVNKSVVGYSAEVPSNEKLKVILTLE